MHNEASFGDIIVSPFKEVLNIFFPNMLNSLVTLLSTPC